MPLFLELTLINATAPLKVCAQREIKNPHIHTHTNAPFCNRLSSRPCKRPEQISQEKDDSNPVEPGKQDLTQCDFASYGSY